jgi:hypothetical protein
VYPEQALVASDGRVYVGLNYHGGGASVAVYDPKTDTMKILGDMNRITGQTNLAVEPQAKVHSQISEGPDGKIYFGTHLSAFYGFATFPSPDAYPGGHWMVYDPKTDVVTDLGIALKGNGLLTMTMDPQRGRLYAVAYPQAHFLYYDLATGKTTDMGQVQNWDAVGRTLAVDDLGRVYGCWGRGRLYRYDPEKDAIENLQIQLPQREVGVPIHRRPCRPTRSTTWRDAPHGELRTRRSELYSRRLPRTRRAGVVSERAPMSLRSGTLLDQHAIVSPLCGSGHASARCAFLNELRRGLAVAQRSTSW